MRRRLGILVVFAVTLTGLLAGCGGQAAVPGAASRPASGPSSGPASGPSPGTKIRPGAAIQTVAPAAPVSDSVGLPAVPPPRAVPVSVEIPALGVRSRLLRLGVDRAGVLRPPTRPELAGWFAAGPVPGQRGPALIAGHRDAKTGPAVFYRLADLRPGDAVLVRLSGGVAVRFRVQEVRRFPKSRFPTEAAYGPTPDRALRLVTCGGDYVRSAGGYQDNVVVLALAER